MKLTYIKVVIFIVTIFLATNAKAQNHDYVVTYAGDTILCKILAPGF